MLIYLRVTPTNVTLPCDVDPFGLGAQLQDFVHKQCPELVVRRLLYSGKVIDVKETLGTFLWMPFCAISVVIMTTCSGV